MKNIVLLLGAAFILCLFASPAKAQGTTETTGDILRILLPATAFGTTFWHDDKEGRSQFYWSFLSSLGTTQILKWSIDKKRPDNSDYDAFPSGHTADAFQGATFLQKRYGWHYGVPAYLAAGVVGYSRLQADQHDEVDVMAGALIGILSNFFTTRYIQPTILPIVGKHSLAIKARMTW